MAKRKRMTDEDILTALEANVRDSVGYSDSKLSQERENVLRYYHGALPLPHHSGNSKYVSMDVYDTVESTKAQMLEVYSGGTNIVEFTPQGEDDVEKCHEASAYTDYVIWRQNDAYGIFSDVIQDGLLARVGIVKVYWEDYYEEMDEEFEDITEDDLPGILGDEDVEIQEITQDPDTLTLSGTITRRTNKSQVCIDPVPPEEFLISKDATTTADALFQAQRTETTQGELIKRGFKKSLVSKIQTDDSTPWNPERQARLNNLGFERGDRDTAYDESSRKLTVYEAYIQLDVDGNGTPRLWKFTYSGQVILDRQQVKRAPFIAWVPLPLPHSFLGSNFAKLVIPIQNARTVLMRGILDHTVKTNNPRTVVVKGALVNPRELLDNRMGGVLNVTRPDGIFPEQQAPLNPFVYQTIELLDADKEDTTGISKLSQGLNKDAISKQNSEGMVENLVSLSMIRQKIIAKNFANQFVIPLYLEVYRLVLENEDRQKIVDVAGNWVEVNPQDWVERKDAQVALKLGYGEQERDAQETLGLHVLFSQDPKISPAYPKEKTYNLISKYLKLKGCKNVNDYLLPPDQTPDPPPPPEIMLKQQELQLKEREIAMKEKQSASDIQLANLDQQLERMSKMIDLMVSQREMERKEFEAKSKVEVAHRELDIIESQPADETKQSNIVSPNS